MARQGEVVTIYEAEVLPQCGLPPQVAQTFLVPSQAGRTAWRLVVVWSSRAAFEASRETEILPGFAISGMGSM